MTQGPAFKRSTCASLQILLLSLLIQLLPAISNAASGSDRGKGSRYGGGGGDIPTANGEFSNFIPEEDITGPIDFSDAEQQSDGSLCVIKTKMIDKVRQKMVLNENLLQFPSVLKST